MDRFAMMYYEFVELSKEVWIGRLNVVK